MRTCTDFIFLFIRKVRFRVENKKENSLNAIPRKRNLRIIRGFNGKGGITTVWAFHLI